MLDVKGDLTAAVLGLVRVICPHVPVHLLNPFDRFGSALDPHEFAADPTQIMQLVHALTYRKRDARSDDFFDSAARGHLIDLVKVLAKRTPGEWSWRTLHLIATSYDLLGRVLKHSKHGRRKADKAVKKTFSGIVSTVEAWLDQYGSAFACWDRSPTLSLGSFLAGRGVLLLTVPEDQVEAIAPVARLEAVVVGRLDKDWYTTEDVAALMGRAPWTVRQWCLQGRVRAKKRSGTDRWVVARDEVDRLMNNGLLKAARR